jgi:tetratricopeptide (TPR) repeat protein
MKHFFLVVLMMSTVAGIAQTTKQPVQKQPTQTKPTTEQAKPQINVLTQHYLRKYSVASQWGDMEVAKSALYDLIVENPANDSLLITLAYYYYENQQYAPSLLVNRELLARNPKSTSSLEMAAVSAEALGVKDQSLQNYETLYLLTNHMETLYKIAFLQFDLKRYKESLTNADILLSKPEVTTTKVYFNDVENKPKEYVMKVAVLNLKGMIAQEEGDKVNAKKFFDEALVLAPDFVLAKQSLAKLK